MRASQELRATLLQAVEIARAESSLTVGLRHLTQALVDPLPGVAPESRGPHVPSSREARIACEAALIQAEAQGANVAERRHLASVLGRISARTLGQALYDKIHLIEPDDLVDEPVAVESGPDARLTMTARVEGHAIARHRPAK
ncbi:MAG: hypothetical protein QOI74_3824 [Micromonosporaceae bacterium]|jgi:hypothetical protein|nr:hypothetical protein [Micromonosporaceae bacterium]